MVHILPHEVSSILRPDIACNSDELENSLASRMGTEVRIVSHHGNIMG